MEIGPKMPPLHPQLHIFICMCKTHICVDIEKIHIDTHKTARRYLLVHCLGVLEIYDAQPVYGLHRIAGWYREWSLNRPASRPHPHTHISCGMQVHLYSRGPRARSLSWALGTQSCAKHLAQQRVPWLHEVTTSWRISHDYSCDVHKCVDTWSIYI